MEQEQAGTELIRPFISRRYPLYQSNTAFEHWLFQKAGTDGQKLDEYLDLLYGYGYITGNGTISTGYEDSPDPASVRKDIERRLSLLDPETLGLLRLASVEGERFSTVSLAALAGDRVEGRLQPAIEVGVIAPDSNDAGMPVLGHLYRFVPLQIRDILYEALSDEERADAHTKLVVYLGEELGRTSDPGEQDMLGQLIGEHNKRFARPDPSSSKQ